MNTVHKKLKLWKKIVLIILFILFIGILLFLLWASKISNADSQKLKEFFDQNANMMVINEHQNYWEILPKNNDCMEANCLKTVDTGVIFYPGAKIDPQAYFYKLDFLTNSQPFKTKLFITKPPLHLALFGINQADEIIQKNPHIKRWVIGGHSLGGAMSCEYAKTHSEKITDLLLLGAYCGSSLRDTHLKVISIHGSEDGVLTPQKVTENNINLPTSFKEFMIAGMNHAQVGNYGNQDGDNVATKSDEDVKKEIITILKNEI